MRFSEKFSLASHKQIDYEFVNIRIDSDNRLFIDPTRIIANQDAFSQKCNLIIQDFFETIFDLYVSGKQEQAKKYFSYSGESNEIFLGYTNGFPRGTGNSEESLSAVFDFIHNKGLLKERIVGKIEDFHIFVPDFGEDLLSDLVASIIKKQLIDFTQEQCNKYSIRMDKKIQKNFWNHVEHEWYKIETEVPQVNGYPIVLIPKNMVVKNYLYSPERYWTQVISEWRQRYHKENNTQFHQDNVGRNGVVSKDIIKEFEAEGMSDKEYLLEQTVNNISLIETFRTNIEHTQKGSNNNLMSDIELETFIEESYDRIPKTTAE